MQLNPMRICSKMGFFKRLFGLEQKDATNSDKIEEVSTQQIEEKVQEVSHNADYTTGKEEICDACGQAIWGDQQPIHKFGKVYHNKPCWRNKQKEAKRLGFAGKLPS